MTDQGAFQPGSDEHASSVYNELRRIAAAYMRRERKGFTLQATALVHEAYLRIIGTQDPQAWDGRGHFFAAAAEAMRRILVDNARRKKRLRHGGDRKREELDLLPIEAPLPREDLLALDAALEKLRQTDGTAAELVQLRYFAGLTNSQAAEILNLSPRTAERAWAYARAFLKQEMLAAGGE